MEFLLAKLRILTYCPRQGGSRHLSSRTFLLHCTLDHYLLLETLLTWRFQNRTLLVAVVVLLFLLFLFLYHLFFFFFSLAVSSQLSSGAPILPLPKVGWLCRFYLDRPVLLGLQEIPLLVFYLSFISWWLQVSSSNFFPAQTSDFYFPLLTFLGLPWWLRW